MSELEPAFPLEFLVPGTPISHQSALPAARDAWKAQVRACSSETLPEGHWATQNYVSVTLYCFPVTTLGADLDNIAKYVLDALKAHIYIDDSQVERLVLQKFEEGRIFDFVSPGPTLARAINGEKPVLYVRISRDPHEDLK